MALLHTVNKSPFEKNTLSSCLRMAKDGSAVLMIEDGVYGALKGTSHSAPIEERLGGVKFYALGPDLAARGYEPSHLIEGIEVVDYAGFVDLATEFDVVQSWL
ncbi:MAG: sulfurtransferase complex subunit TusB [Rhodospirillales bacterium]|nr:sulfurtransferase complex subunit TusB [Rhodospirillales bacterium]